MNEREKVSPVDKQPEEIASSIKANQPTGERWRYFPVDRSFSLLRQRVGQSAGNGTHWRLPRQGS